MTRKLAYISAYDVGVTSLGAWEVDITNYGSDGTKTQTPGEWHFGWALEGGLSWTCGSPRYASLEWAAGGVDRTAVLASLGLAASDLLPGYEPMVVNTGVNGLMVPLRDAATVGGVEPDVAAVERISAALDLVEYYVFSPETQVPGRDAGARMFAPLYGIPEEAATGMAAGALACYLHDYLGVRKETMLSDRQTVVRGVRMGLPVVRMVERA